MHLDDTFKQGYDINKVELQEMDWILVGRYVFLFLNVTYSLIVIAEDCCNLQQRKPLSNVTLFDVLITR